MQQNHKGGHIEARCSDAMFLQFSMGSASPKFRHWRQENYFRSRTLVSASRQGPTGRQRPNKPTYYLLINRLSILASSTLFPSPDFIISSAHGRFQLLFDIQWLDAPSVVSPHSLSGSQNLGPSE